MKYHGLELNSYNKKDLGIDKIDLKYYKREKFGQIKLILNEIMFIEHMKSLKEKCTPFHVCGGAPGIHYDLLSDMYPEIEFILYDKREFYENLKKKKNIKLINKYVNEDVVRREFDPSGVFISDIRSLDITKLKNNNNPLYKALIMKDMYSQLSYFYSSKCKYGMLKFKVIDNCMASYPEGLLWIQPYINTNELRLVLNKANDFITYDGKEIDDQCQMINNYWRQTDNLQVDNQKIRDIIDNNKNLHYNFDTISLIDILLKANKIKWLESILKYLDEKKNKKNKLNDKSDD